MTLEEIVTATTKARNSKTHLEATVLARESQILKATCAVQAFEDVQRLVQETAQEVQEELRFHLQDLVQHALDSIFPGVYTFRVEFAVARGRTDARLLLEKGGNVMDDIVDCEGGTVVQIISMALRVAVWTLAPTDNVLVFDEPGTAISAGYRPIFAEMIRGLSQRLGIQIILVSHDETYIAQADRTHTVTQGPDGRSKISFVDT